jgi:hypothetical protein
LAYKENSLLDWIQVKFTWTFQKSKIVRQM